MTWSIGSKSKAAILGRSNFLAPLEKFKKSKTVFLTGFTLLELLVVVVIISGLLTLSLPRFRNSFNSLKFDNFCQNLIFRMRYFQERATLEQKTFRLNLDSSNNMINIEVSQDVAQDFVSVKGLMGKRIVIPQDYEILTDAPIISFYPDSTIEGDDLEISDSQNKATVYITESIGKVELVKHD